MNRQQTASASVLALVVVFALSLTVTPTASRQDPQAKAPAQNQPGEAAAKGETKSGLPPEVEALNQALRMPDVAKRFAALQKVIEDYPKTEAANLARTQLANQAGSSLKASRTAVQALVKHMSSSKNPADYSQLASTLLGAEMFLDEAEEIAKQGLAVDEATYVASVKDGAAPDRVPLVRTLRDGIVEYREGIVLGGRRAGTETNDAELREQFKSSHVTLLATLGQVYAKRGKTADAERTLKEAYAADLPAAAKRAVAGALADLASKAGDTRAEIEYRAAAYVAGASPALRAPLEAAYRKANNGSLDGLETLLDAQYRRITRPIEVAHYDRPRAATERRLVLAELFTGAACPPCVGADMAFDAALERYSRDDLTLIVYHEHIPGPDPMTNPSTEARKYIYAVNGVPTFAIDGKSTVGGGGATDAEEIFKEMIGPLVEKQMAAAPEARIDLKAAVSGSRIRVNAAVDRVKSKSSHLKLQVALVEELQRYSGPNGIRFHPMVVRSLAGSPLVPGFGVTARGAKVEYVFDLAKIQADNRRATDDFLSKPFRGGDKPQFTDGRRDAIDPAHVMVVAFVQDEDPGQDQVSKPQGAEAAKPARMPASPVRHVLQAAMVKLGTAKKTTN